MLVGVDLTKRSGPVLRFAYAFADQHDQPLYVAHFTPERRDQEDAERLLAESVAGLREEFPDVHTRLRVIHGEPHRTPVADGRPQAPAGRRAAPRARHLRDAVHHVQASIVDRSPCPVAVVPVDVSAAGEHVLISSGQVGSR